MSQVGGKNAEAVEGCVMLYWQNARIDDIALLMPSSY